jgi:stage V sporulation protein B
MKNLTFLRGTILLTTSDIVNRTLGLFFQSMMIRHAGAESLGLLQMSLPLLSLLATCISAGFPTAISKLIAEAHVTIDRARIQRILLVSFFSSTFFAICTVFAVYVMRDWLLPMFFHDQRAIRPFLVMLPVLLLTGWTAILRGYFYGSQLFRPPAIASVLEQIARILFTFFCFHVDKPNHVITGAIEGALSLVISELAGCIYLAYSFSKSMLWKTKGNKRLMTFRWLQTFIQLSELSLPMTGNSVASVLMYTFEASLIPDSLQNAGCMPSQATALFGLYTGVVIPVFFFATVFSDSLGMTLIASVTEMLASGQHLLVKRHLWRIIRIVAAFSLAYSSCLMLFATPLTRILYDTPEAGILLMHIAPFLFFVCMQWPLASVLQGLQRSGLVLVHSIIGDFVRLILIILWGSRPSLGIYGVLWAFNISNVLITCLHARAVHRLIMIRYDSKRM